MERLRCGRKEEELVSHAHVEIHKLSHAKTTDVITLTMHVSTQMATGVLTLSVFD